jgi:hypothetical protein
MSEIMDGDGRPEGSASSATSGSEAATAPLPTVTASAYDLPVEDHRRFSRSGVRLKTVLLGLVFILLSLTRATAVWIDVDVDGPSVLAGVIGLIGVLMVVGAVSGARRREQ